MRKTALCAVIGLAVCLGLPACTQFPELDASNTPGVADAPFPQLVPLDSLLTGPAPRANVAMIGQIEDRVAGLRTRGARLQSLRPAASSGLEARVARLRQKAAALRATTP